MWIIDMLTGRGADDAQSRAELATVLSGGLLPGALFGPARPDRRYE